MNTMTGNEGPSTKMVEKATSHVPSLVFLSASLVAMGTSFTLKCCGKHKAALFIGQWAAPFLLLGIYNKIVKTEGHD